jgi:hypothetical protein
MGYLYVVLRIKSLLTPLLRRESFGVIMRIEIKKNETSLIARSVFD